MIAITLFALVLAPAVYVWLYARFIHQVNEPREED